MHVLFLSLLTLFSVAEDCKLYGKYKNGKKLYQGYSCKGGICYFSEESCSCKEDCESIVKENLRKEGFNPDDFFKKNTDAAKPKTQSLKAGSTDKKTALQKVDSTNVLTNKLVSPVEKKVEVQKEPSKETKKPRIISKKRSNIEDISEEEIEKILSKANLKKIRTLKEEALQKLRKISFLDDFFVTNYTVLFDTSGSMEGVKLESAFQALRGLVQSLHPEQKVIVRGMGARVAAGSIKGGDLSGLKAIERKLKSPPMNAQNGDEIVDSFQAAKEDPTQVILLLTDAGFSDLAMAGSQLCSRGMSEFDNIFYGLKEKLNSYKPLLFFCFDCVDEKMNNPELCVEGPEPSCYDSVNYLCLEQRIGMWRDIKGILIPFSLSQLRRKAVGGIRRISSSDLNPKEAEKLWKQFRILKEIEARQSQKK